MWSGVSSVETVAQDLLYGIRGIWRSPAFTATVVLTLALGIGANTALFSVVHAVLLSPPHYPSGERLVQLWERTDGQDLPVSWINFQHWRTENHTLEDLAGFESADLTLTGRGDALVAHAGVVSTGFFRLTGWPLLSGRSFNDADDRPGAAPVVVLTGEFWARVLGGNPSVIGTSLVLDGKAYQVVGVIPPDLKFFTQAIDFYLPAGPRDGNTLIRSRHDSMVLLGLLKRGITLAAARADLDAIMRHLTETDPGPENDHRSSVAWLAGSGTENVRQGLLSLMAAVGLVLIIACANVASLMLVRSTMRVREMAIRSAIGATKSRLTRQVLTESLLITALGGSLGLLVAGTCLRLLVRFGPNDIPRLWDAKLNLTVLTFTAAITIATGILCGLAPAWNAGRIDLTTSLKEGAPSSGSAKGGSLVREGLVVVEVSLALVLSFACALLVRSLVLAQTASPGFDTTGLLALEIQLPPERYKTAEQTSHFYSRLIEKLSSNPGVISAGAINCPPSTGGCARGWYSIADLAAPPRPDVPLALLTKADAAYFQTMKIQLLAGQVLANPEKILINETLARHWWPAPQLALGHPLKFGGPFMDGPTYEIEGVVADVKQAGLDEPPFSEIYLPLAKNVPHAMVIMIRAHGNPDGLISSVRRDLASIDPDVPVHSQRPFEQWMSATLARRHFSTLLFEIFALLSLLLSAMGIYAVLNYWVTVREKEIAIRLALGAERALILLWTVRRAARLVLLGVVIGAIGCWCASRWLANLLFGITPGNVPAVLLAFAAVIGIATLAVSLPAWRASRLNSLDSLRDS
jgi:putative ABC transport system permease protein